MSGYSTGSTAGQVHLPPPLPSGRRAMLFALRRLGDADVDELAEALGMTISGARQHLEALSEQGLVDSEDQPRVAGERGRPKLSYHVTDLADVLFPKAYGALTNELLGYLDDEDQATVDRLFARRRDHRIENARERLSGKRSFGSKIEELARILDQDGYLATAEALGEGRYRITEHNCAIDVVARKYGQACVSEIEFIRAVLPDASVERTRHMASGDRFCGYEIREG